MLITRGREREKKKKSEYYADEYEEGNEVKAERMRKKKQGKKRK